MTQVKFIEGIDVSRWQSNVDWPHVAASGIKYAFVKASQGLHADPNFARNWTAARSAGLIRGAYHFATPLRPALDQANFFLETVGDLGVGDLPLALDIERTDNLPPSRVASFVNDFVLQLQMRTERDIIIYTSASFWDTYVKIINFSHLPLWVAHYTDQPRPAIPRSWNDFTFWQYTQSGTIAGVKGHVDRNRFNGSIEDLELLAGLHDEIVPEPARVSSIPLQSTDFLKRGSSGESVRALQNALCALGYLRATEVDAEFGPHTQAALSAFQFDNNLDDDGRLGSITRACINAQLAKKG